MEMKSNHLRLRQRLLSPLTAVALITASLWSSGCSEDTTVTPPTTNVISKYNADVATSWFEFQMQLVQNTPGFSPPVASRAFGYAGVTLYEAVLPGMSLNRSLVGQLNGLSSVPQPTAGSEYHWPTVANSAMAQINRKLFGNATAAFVTRIDSLENVFATQYKTEVTTDVFNRSDAHGKSVADAIFEWSKTDGGHEGYLKNFPATYTPPTGPGMWVQTPRKAGASQLALQPFWGKNRPFVLSSSNALQGNDPGAPLPYSTDPNSDFYKEGLEVYNSVKNLSAEQLAIALFWSDDPGKTCTPPGHSVSIMCQCVKMGSLKLDAAAEAFAKIGIAVSDAFVACWDAKFKYNLLRPISYIQLAIDTNWNKPTVTDPLETPPFPEYPSGHSVQSGAMSEVLSTIFGHNFGFTDHTHDASGKAPRSFTSFEAAANEAAISRLYGGIHYRSAIERGVAQGKKIGQAVNALKFKK